MILLEAKGATVILASAWCEGNVLRFSSGTFHSHAGCALGRHRAIDERRSLLLTAASLSVLGYEGRVSRPVIRMWNDTRHAAAWTATAAVFCAETFEAQLTPISAGCYFEKP